MEKAAFSSTDAFSVGALTTGRTVRMENTMTLVNNDKEDITLATVIPGPPTV